MYPCPSKGTVFGAGQGLRAGSLPHTRGVKPSWRVRETTAPDPAELGYFGLFQNPIWESPKTGSALVAGFSFSLSQGGGRTQCTAAGKRHKKAVWTRCTAAGKRHKEALYHFCPCLQLFRSKPALIDDTGLKFTLHPGPGLVGG